MDRHPFSPSKACEGHLTYVAPTLPGPLSGEAIALYVTGLVASFPDLAFIVEGISVDGDRVTAQWRMQGANTGPFLGRPTQPAARVTCRGLT
ncbi:MAG: ester cyclase [Pseudonocardiaceae bacterium]